MVLVTDEKLISERTKDDNEEEDRSGERLKEQLVFLAAKVNLT